MSGSRGGPVTTRMRQLFAHGTAVGLPDGELMRRFARHEDEAAFEAVVTVKSEAPSSRRWCSRA